MRSVGQRMWRVIHIPPAVSLICAGALVAAGCGSSGSGGSGGGAAVSVPGITKTQILIGSHQPLTGPAAPGYSEIAPAAGAPWAAGAAVGVAAAALPAAGVG